MSRHTIWFQEGRRSRLVKRLLGFREDDLSECPVHCTSSGPVSFCLSHLLLLIPYLTRQSIPVFSRLQKILPRAVQLMSCSPSLLLNIFFFSYFDWHQPVISLLTFKDSSFVFSTFSFTPTHRILLPKAYVIFYMYSFSSGASCKLMTVSTVFSCHLIPSLNRLCPLPFRFPHPFSPTMTSSYVRALTLLG